MKEKKKIIETIITCPRCQQISPINRRYCKNCGYDFKVDLNDEKTEELTFGLPQPTTAINIDKLKKTYSQELTPTINNYRLGMNIMAMILGIMLLLIAFIPIFSSNNIVTSTLMIAPYYAEIIDESLAINNYTNAISLFLNAFHSFGSPYLLSTMLSIYELVTSLMVIAISFIGLLLIIFSFFNLVLNKKYWFINKIIQIDLALILILMFVFDCYGLYVIALIILLISYLIIDYIVSIISKEKRFSLKVLICKSGCLVFLLYLLILTASGLVNLNVSLGSNLYIGTAYDLDKIPVITTCNGFLLQIMEIIQWVSTDIKNNINALIWCISSGVFYILYIVLLVVAITRLLYSYAKQNVKFPMLLSIASLIFFYLFAFSILQYNGIINGVSINMYIDSLGIEAYGLLTQSDKDAINNANSVFVFNSSMLLMVISYFPSIIGVRILRKFMLKKTY